MHNILTKIISKWRFLLVITIPAIMLCSFLLILPKTSSVANHGSAELSNVDFTDNKLVSLNGQWEFYWGRLLSHSDFNSGQRVNMDSYMKVPGVWSEDAATDYSSQGIATYRLMLSYPSSLKDPALRIQNVANAYRLYVNGRLLAKAGAGLDNKASFRNEDDILIINLPRDLHSVELVFQVSNLNCATGGLRVAPLFGSRDVLEQQRMLKLLLQMVFIGGVFIFGFHYIFLFFLQTHNRTALYFAIFCLVSALRSLVWGETPLTILFPHAQMDVRMYMNYLTGYNLIAIVILFMRSIYPSEYNKRLTGLIILPSVIFDVLLLVTSPERMTFLTKSLYLVVLVQMLFVLGVQIKAVIHKRENAIFMFLALCVLIWSVNVDILNFIVIGNIYLSSTFLLGNFAFILAMSYIQAMQQAAYHRKLILYNEKMIEADRLKDQIMATELSFLQAQIKPHFLYNALSAIANVCEKDGKQAGKLIIDLAIYLRGSLEFNNLDKLVTTEKELEFVDTYFRIEQARFGSKIQLHKEIEIPLEVQIPVLILQPLVENAVRHGISKKPEGGTVTLRMIKNNEFYCIEIEDDGVGIDGEKQADLLNNQESDRGVGLLNIHNRLLKLYGKGLEITSKPGHTSVKFTIPEGIKQ